jgi:hypothetical protein
LTAKSAPDCPGPKSKGTRASRYAPLLTANDVGRLDAVYLAAYRNALAHREVEPLAVHLHLPKLPELLSLSIAALCGCQLLHEELQPAPFPDDLHGRARRRVAVKGTGPSAWIAITDTDRASDALIWVDYAGRVRDGGPVVVRALTERRWLRGAPRRVTLPQLLSPSGPPFDAFLFWP